MTISTRCQREGLHGSALEELREETQRKYAALLRKELQPTLEYFELINEELMEEIPLKEEDDPNFDYPEGYDWREGDYMWLLFKIQQHFAHQECMEWDIQLYKSHPAPTLGEPRASHGRADWNLGRNCLTKASGQKE